MGNVLYDIRRGETVGKENTGYVKVPEDAFSTGLSKGLNIPPPLKPNDVNDSAKIVAYHESKNLCWLLLLLFLLIFCFSVGFVFDAGLAVSWTSQGSGRLNSRHVPISSVHSGNVRLESPTFCADGWKNSTTCTPAVWGGSVFVASWNGDVAAFDEHTGAQRWKINLCRDVYSLPSSTCDSLVASRKYVTVATPSVWGDNVVVSVKKPADIVVLDRGSGRLVQRATISSDPFASLTQSGTIWDDYIVVGTSMDEEDAADDVNCTFVGKLWKWNLGKNLASWSVSMEDPYGDHPSSPTGFSGMPVWGSSPAVSVKEGWVAISVGPAVCKPRWYLECLNRTGCGTSRFNSSAYEEEFDACHANHASRNVLFNSVVALDLENGAVKWHEKLMGRRAWAMACEGMDLPFPCRNHSPDDEPCTFSKNPFSNCPTESDSCGLPYQFVDDPILQIHSEGWEGLYVVQHSGLVYALRMNPKDDQGRFVWTFSATGGEGMGGIAADKRSVYFTHFNEKSKPWNHSDASDPSRCGGWGALNADDGMPRWFATHPFCNSTHSNDCNGNCSSRPWLAGSQSAPSVTNDVLFVATQDSTLESDTDWDPSPHCGGHAYAVDASTGETLSSWESGSPFWEQGFSIHGRCVYAGNGPNPKYVKAEGTSFCGWCVKNAISIEPQPF